MLNRKTSRSVLLAHKCILERKSIVAEITKALACPRTSRLAATRTTAARSVCTAATRRGLGRLIAGMGGGQGDALESLAYNAYLLLTYGVSSALSRRFADYTSFWLVNGRGYSGSYSGRSACSRPGTTMRAAVAG